MQNLNDLYLFTEVVEHSGFAPASRATGVPKSRLSRRVAQLEEELGARLLQRSTRRFAVTDVGQSFYEHCRAMVTEARAAEEAVARTRAEPRGTVRLTCPITLAQGPMAAMLSRFLDEHPLVRVEMEATNRRVDVIAEGVDVALRVRQPPLEDTDLVVKILAHDLGVLAASPALLQRAGRPATPDDLSRLPTLSMSQTGGEHIWRLTGAEGETRDVRHRPRLATDEMVTLRRAALDGVGVVLLPLLMVEPDIASGALEPLLPDWTAPRGVIHAVFASRRGLLPAVRLLLDRLGETFAACDRDQAGSPRRGEARK
jgi:DNA-binding transcriptional LysR family regulator